jgi:hypothetical protein
LSAISVAGQRQTILLVAKILPSCQKNLALYTAFAIYYGVLMVFEFKLWEKIVIEVKKWQILTTFEISYF